MGRGKRIPSALVSWQRREESQQLPSPPSPARGRIQPRGESSSLPAALAMDLTALAWPIWLSASAQPGLPSWAASAPDKWGRI